MLHCNVKGICAQAHKLKRINVFHRFFNFTRSHQMHNIYSSYLHSILSLHSKQSRNARKQNRAVHLMIAVLSISSAPFTLHFWMSIVASRVFVWHLCAQVGLGLGLGLGYSEVP
jgi:hypothetical protein